MCGFIGRILSDRDRAVSPLSNALLFLHRRGPDSNATWRSVDGGVELLHARLAIVDLDGRATQPLVDTLHGLVLVFNGEIYNYVELRQELAAYPFRTGSDSEVILAAYALRGLVGLNLLKGMFSLALVDTRKRRVVLARDAVGKKPLFLSRINGVVAFGSSVLALAAVSGAGAEVNPEAVEHFWRESFVRPDQSAVRGVTPVLPGQVLELDEDGKVVATSWLTPTPALRYEGETVAEAERNVGRLLELAVSRRLRDNPSPAVFCSGGIDSTVVAMAAVRLEEQGGLRRPLQLLTLGSAVPLTNDEFYARYAARRLRRQVRVVRPRMDGMGQSVREMFALQDEPLGMISFLLLSRLVAAVTGHSRILLTGDGGDEVFLGYGEVAEWNGQPAVANMPDASHVPCGPLLPTWMSAWGVSAATDHLVGHGFTKVDRASAEQGVEVRSPLLDWDLMAYARSLPFAHLAVGGRTKALLKRQFVGWPSWFLERPKQGFTFNLRYSWGVRNYDGLRELVSGDAIAQFDRWLPPELRRSASDWSALAVFRNFPAVWKLAAWSQFLARSRVVSR